MTGEKIWHLTTTDVTNRGVERKKDAEDFIRSAFFNKKQYDETRLPKPIIIAAMDRITSPIAMFPEDFLIPSVMLDQDFADFYPNQCISGVAIEMFLRLAPKCPNMSHATIVPIEFYMDLMGHTYDEFSFENARAWSNNFGGDFLKHPILFTINTKPTGAHWIFVMIEPIEPKMTVINPFGKDRGSKHIAIMLNLEKWFFEEKALFYFNREYTAQNLPSTGVDMTVDQLEMRWNVFQVTRAQHFERQKIAKRKTPVQKITQKIFWYPDLVQQPHGDGSSCGILCAMYQYYILTTGTFPEKDAFQIGDVINLRNFMASEILNSFYCTRVSI